MKKKKTSKNTSFFFIRCSIRYGLLLLLLLLYCTFFISQRTLLFNISARSAQFQYYYCFCVRLYWIWNVRKPDTWEFRFFIFMVYFVCALLHDFDRMLFNNESFIRMVTGPCASIYTHTPEWIAIEIDKHIPITHKHAMRCVYLIYWLDHRSDVYAYGSADNVKVYNRCEF